MNKKIVKTMLIKQTKPIVPLECGYEECIPSHAFGPAIRSYYLLHFVVSGKGEFSSKNGRYTLSENDIFIIRPYEITYYEADEKEPWTYIWIGFKSDVPLPKALLENDVIRAPFLRKSFESLISEEYFPNERVDGACETYLAGVIMQMLGLLLRGESGDSDTSENYVSRAKSIIEFEYYNGITVTDIAKRLHLNRSYFTELFKAETGKTPHKYLTDHRMKQAAKLLRKKGLSVSVTALSVGYPDVFVFSRAFKNYFGVTPTEYAKALDI